MSFIWILACFALIPGVEHLRILHATTCILGLKIYLLIKIFFGVGLKKEDQIYGTEENLIISSDKIYNVNGLHIELKKYIEDPNIIQLNQNNYNDLSNKLGDLHIYYDQRPMVYERNI